MSDAYRLAPTIAMERFGEEALVFLAESETFITVNEAAADVLGLMLDAFADRAFVGAELVALLLRHYDLEARAATGEAEEILACWTTAGIIVPQRAADAHP